MVSKHERRLGKKKSMHGWGYNMIYWDMGEWWDIILFCGTTLESFGLNYQDCTHMPRRNWMIEPSYSCIIINIYYHEYN
jgi:hypothetical protein